MHSSLTPVTRHRFGGVEEAEALLRGSGLPIDLTQLVGGAQQGDLLRFAIGPMRLLRIRMAQPFHASGAKPVGHQVVTVPLDRAGAGAPLRSHGQVLPPGCLFGLAPHGEIHLSTAGSCHLALVMLERHRFQLQAQALGGPEFTGRVLAGNWVPLDPGRHGDLRRSLLELFALAETRPGMLALPAVAQLAGGNLLPLLVEALAHGAQCQPQLRRPPARIELVKLAQRWMAEHPHRPITLEALCREVHAGRRSLIQGFRDHLGMGPMAYLKLQRLHGVRRQLLAADPRDTRIHALAVEWGFLNPGHFARDYRNLFGELPGATLRRSPSRRQEAQAFASVAS